MVVSESGEGGGVLPPKDPHADTIMFF